MKKYTLYLVAFSLVIFLGLASATFAQTLPGGPSSSRTQQSPSQTLFDSVKQAVKWATGIAALLAGVMFAVGAIEYMFFANPDGKDRMFSSVIGLVLCL